MRGRKLAAACLAGALILPMGWSVANAANTKGEPPSTAAFAALNPVTELTAQTFLDPPQSNMPWVRWNFPPATATIAGLEADLQDAYDHNIGGVEIGQGGVPTKEQLTAIYKKANTLGIKVSLKAANGLPGTTYDASNDYARRTITNHRIAVDSGQNVKSALPGPTTGNPGTIIAVLAYKCTTSPCASAGTIDLDRNSAINLTDTITGTNTDGYQDGTTAGSIDWTAPAGEGQWLLITFRAIPFGNQPETLTLEGTKQVTTAYDSYFGGGLGELVKANGGDFFVDSHASDPWGAPEELWSSDMAAQFQARAGYDIIPELPALVHPTMAGLGLGGGAPAPTAVFYSFNNDTDTRVRSDFNNIRSDLFTENRIIPFQDWAHTYNTALRLQQEDGPSTSIADQLQTSAVLDRSEYEGLTGSDQADIYRPMASANHMTGNTWYSTECCAALNQSYTQTYQDMIIRMNHEYAGGVNRPVYHIMPYLDTPTTSWPGLGFNANKVAFSNAWNRTQPFWVDSAAMNDYFARNNLVLTQGAAKVDVAVYMTNYSSPSAFSTTEPNNRHWMDLGLQQAGYNWDYLNENLFDLPNAVVTHKRLAEDGPAYKALIFDQFLAPSTNTAKGGLSIEAAKDILQYAKDGLPVIFVGTPNGTASMPVSEDAELAAIVAQILALKNVTQVTSEAEVPGTLAKLGIEPAAKPAAPTTLLSQRRSDADTGTDYYYIYNQGVESAPAGNTTFGKNPSNLYEEPTACRVTTVNNPCMATGEAVSTTVTLEGKGNPYRLDTFSGAITPIAEYVRKGNTVSVKLELGRDESTVIALSQDPKLLGGKLDESVTSTTAKSAAQVGNSLVVRATQAGKYTTKLSSGKEVNSTIASVPAPINLTNSPWKLNAEDWKPTNPYGTLGAAGTLTTKAPVTVDLTSLKAWPDIPELSRASGIGTYTTEVSLPADWSKNNGATLSLGQVTDTFTLKVNGETVSVDQISPTLDIGKYLHAGTNKIEVRVTTTLNNRLFALDTAVEKRGVLQNYGLVGPVVLTPYTQAVVWEGK